MEGCAFSSYMYVLINGSTIKDFEVEQGLREGDLLSPFLFVLVMEVLTSLMNKAVDKGEFRGFKINEEEEVNLLQFADDTIMLAKGSYENIWCMKAILRGFEMMSGLKINFHKSKLYGIDMGDWIMKTTSIYLSCNIDTQPFKFLGVKLRDSPRKLSMWKDVIKQFNSRLGVS